MKIVPTFVKNLYAFRYDGEALNELDRLLDLWNDLAYLTEFFVTYETHLGYFGVGAEEAITMTLHDVDELDEFLANLESSSRYSLELFFRPLNDFEYKAVPLSRQKAKRRKSWLRLYAIKIDAEHFVITGGTIKLTHRMVEMEPTRNELAKLEKCRDYLQLNDVFDADSLFDLFTELGQ